MASLLKSADKKWCLPFTNLPKEEHQAATDKVRRGNSPNSFPGAGIAAKDITWKENWVSIYYEERRKKTNKSRMQAWWPEFGP